MTHKFVEIEGVIYGRRERSVLFSAAGDRASAVVLPLAQIEINQREGAGSVTVSMPDWLAIERGLV